MSKVFKCACCGGNLLFNEGNTTGVCDSCGSRQIIPQVSDDRIANLFNRANELRLHGRFDEAAEEYRNILREDNRNAAAHWGLLLSRFGIEFIEDPVDKKRKPTWHRLQTESVLDDMDYQSALADAPDTHARSQYELDGAAIHEVQKGFLGISNKEDPFDVFICYKETDENGKQTKESARAHEIYLILKKSGYRIFYARETLSGRLGHQYEPIIFAAIQSSKIMLVVGSKPEHFNAVWVKNEWSRFQALRSADPSRLLIPCYFNMDAYGLPPELARCQSSDMGRMGFIPELESTVEKVIRKQPASGQEPVTGEAVRIRTEAEALCRRARTFLEDGAFDRAKEQFNRSLDLLPEQASAYIGLLCASRKLRDEKALGELPQSPENDPDFQRALRYATEEEKSRLTRFLEQIKNRLYANVDAKYEAALATMQEAGQMDESSPEALAAKTQTFMQGVQLFSDLGKHRDSAKLALRCRECARQCNELAIALGQDQRYASAALKMALAADIEPETPDAAREKAESLHQASGLFGAMGAYRDAAEQARQCAHAATELLRWADYSELSREHDSVLAIPERTAHNIQTKIRALRKLSGGFAELSDYNDASDVARKCLEEGNRLALQLAARRRRKFMTFATGGVVLIVAGLLAAGGISHYERQKKERTYQTQARTLADACQAGDWKKIGQVLNAPMMDDVQLQLAQKVLVWLSGECRRLLGERKFDEMERILEQATTFASTLSIVERNSVETCVQTLEGDLFSGRRDAAFEKMEDAYSQGRFPDGEKYAIEAGGWNAKTQGSGKSPPQSVKDRQYASATRYVEAMIQKKDWRAAELNLQKVATIDLAKDRATHWLKILDGRYQESKQAYDAKKYLVAYTNYNVCVATQRLANQDADTWIVRIAKKQSAESAAPSAELVLITKLTSDWRERIGKSDWGKNEKKLSTDIDTSIHNEVKKAVADQDWKKVGETLEPLLAVKPMEPPETLVPPDPKWFESALSLRDGLFDAHFQKATNAVGRGASGEEKTEVFEAYKLKPTDARISWLAPRIPGLPATYEEYLGTLSPREKDRMKGQPSFKMNLPDETIYDTCRISDVELDGVSISHSKGASKILYRDLDAPMRKLFGYNQQVADNHARILRKKNANTYRLNFYESQVEAAKIGDSLAKPRRVAIFPVQSPVPINPEMLKNGYKVVGDAPEGQLMGVTVFDSCKAVAEKALEGCRAKGGSFSYRLHKTTLNWEIWATPTGKTTGATHSAADPVSLTLAEFSPGEQLYLRTMEVLRRNIRVNAEAENAKSNSLQLICADPRYKPYTEAAAFAAREFVVASNAWDLIKYVIEGPSLVDNPLPDICAAAESIWARETDKFADLKKNEWPEKQQYPAKGAKIFSSILLTNGVYRAFILFCDGSAVYIDISTTQKKDELWPDITHHLRKITKTDGNADWEGLFNFIGTPSPKNLFTLWLFDNKSKDKRLFAAQSGSHFWIYKKDGYDKYREWRKNQDE